MLFFKFIAVNYFSSPSPPVLIFLFVEIESVFVLESIIAMMVPYC